MTALAYFVDILDGSTWRSLAPKEGSVTLDEGWAPYMQVGATIATPTDLSLLNLVDPRLGPKVRITVMDNATVVRTFTGTLRTRELNHKTNEIRITVASGEALLQDYAKTETTISKGALPFQSSVRNLINSVVISKIGATLEAGTTDADFTTLTSVTNLITNPSAEIDLTDAAATNSTLIRDTSWFAAGAANFTISTPTAADSFFTMGGGTGGLRLGMQAGKTYTAYGVIRVATAQSGTIDTSRARRIVLIANTGSGDVVLATSTQAPNTAGSTTRVKMTFTLPATTTSAHLRFYHGATSGLIRWDALMLVEGDGIETDTVTDLAYFDGSTPSTSLYNYTWSGTAGKSTSARTPVFSRDPQTLWWEPGETAWDFIKPVLTATGLRLFCDELGKWYLVNSAYLVPGTTTVSQIYNATRATDTIARDNADWYDAVVVKYTWNDTTNAARTAYDAATAAGWTKAIVVEYARPYPGPGAAAYILKKSVGRGRVLDLDAISDFTTTPCKSLVATLPDTPVQTGVVSSVAWNLDTDEMHITSRGLTDTPADSWLAVPDAQTWATIPGDPTWATWTP